MRQIVGSSVVGVAALLAVGGSSRGEDVLPTAIVVPKNATKVVANRPKWDPTDLTVRYEVPEAYPAERYIAEVRKRAEASGFAPVADDGIDARYEYSRKFRWRSHVLRDRGNTGEFFNWQGEWSNRDGDVLSYGLQYRSGLPAPGRASAKPDNETLRVLISLQPKRLISASALPASLIVLDGARDVKAWRDQTEWRGLKYEVAVRYAVIAPYPPKDIMASLTGRLGKQGWTWKADKISGLLGRPSKPPGWNESKRRRATDQQFVWLAKWTNPSGDEMTYSLTQFATLPPSGTEPSAPDSDRLEIHASLLSKKEIARP